MAALSYLLLTPIAATAGAEPPPGEADVAAPGDAIEEIHVVHSPPAERSTPLSGEAFESGRARNLSEALKDIPGLDGVKRGAGGLEPVIRGLGWERVPVQVQGLSIAGAGPGRMDTPAALLGPAAIQSVEVVKGLPSVTLGPGGTGGHVLISTDYERSPGRGTEIGGGVTASYGSARDSFTGVGVVQGGTDRLDVHAGIEGQLGGDYESAGGVKVPAESNAVAGAFSLGFRPTDGQRLNAGYVDSQYWDVDFPSLVMDSDEGWARIVNLGYRFERDEGVFRGLSLRSGYSRARHWMSNRRRASWSQMQMELRGEADSIHAALDTRWQPTGWLSLETGLDFNQLFRDARRQRTMMMKASQDRVWPDIEQWDLGVFVEGWAELAEDWRLRAGARLDQVQSDARAADEPGLAPMMGGGAPRRTVRESFVHYYGASAAEMRRSNTLGSGNLLLEWRPLEGLRAHLGGGVVARAPAVSERYFALSPAPGGYQLGNPDLDPEMRSELELGAAWQREHVELSIQLYHRWIGDYILPTVIQNDQNVDGIGGANDVVRGFRNVDARMYGGEANLTLRAWEYLSLPVTLAYVVGRNTSDGRELPEIPPFEVRAALRVEAGERLPWWAEFGARIVTAQDRIDPAFGENRTPGFQLLHLRAGVELLPGLHTELGIENLSDQDYHEHLTREVPASVGGLAPGDEVPEPGRSFYVTARWEF